eukprot:326936-Prorocentrum_minimum.AAC.9
MVRSRPSRATVTSLRGIARRSLGRARARPRGRGPAGTSVGVRGVARGGSSRGGVHLDVGENQGDLAQVEDEVADAAPDAGRLGAVVLPQAYVQRRLHVGLQKLLVPPVLALRLHPLPVHVPAPRTAPALRRQRRG